MQRLLFILFFAGCSAPAPEPVPQTPEAPASQAAVPMTVGPSERSAAACGDGTDGSPVVARLGEVAVSAADVQAAISLLPVRARQRYLEVEARQTLASRIAEERLMCRTAVARQRLDSAAAARAAESAAAARFVDDVEGAAVTDETIAAYYEAHPERYRMEVIDVSHILVGDETTAERLATELRAGASFEDLAMEHSVDRRSARAGGHLGWVPKGRMDPAWTQAAFAVPVGTISQPTRTAYGWTILSVADRKDTQPLDEVRAGIVRKLREEAAQKLLAELAGGAQVDFVGPLAVQPGAADPNP